MDKQSGKIRRLGYSGFRNCWSVTNTILVKRTSGRNYSNYSFRLESGRCFKKLPVFDKALIVVHLMGNHGSYEERYPHAFNRWTGKSHIDKYDNSILYNDFVMKQLFSAVKDLPNFQGLIYFQIMPMMLMQVLVTTLPDLLSIWHAFHCICISLITIFKNTRILWLF